MRLRLAAKHRGIAYAGCVALVAVAAAVAGFRPVSRFPVAPFSNAALPEDAETLRAGQAVEDLRRLAELELSQRPAQAAGSERIVAPYSPELAASTQSALAAIDFSKTSLVILATRKGTVAIVDGIGVAPGQRLPSGEIVRRVGKTFLVLEDGAGTTRRIDLKDSFGGAAPAPAATAAAPRTAPATRTPPASSTPEPLPAFPALPAPSAPSAPPATAIPPAPASTQRK